MTLFNHTNHDSLAAQIKDAEHQVLNHQRRIETDAAILVENAHRRITDPSTVLLAGCMGFILGELTRRRPSKASGTGKDRRRANQTTPLNSALGLLSSVHSLYTALPVAWMIKSFYQPSTSHSSSEDKVAAKAHSHDSESSAHRQTRNEGVAC